MKVKQLMIYLVPIIFYMQACQFKDYSETESKSDETISQTTKSDNNIKIADNSMTSLDWHGVYAGKLPCSDCEGVQTTIELRKDLTFSMQSKSIGKSNTITNSRGTFTWNSQGSVITLKEESGKIPVIYQVGENVLTQIDMRGDKIDGGSNEAYKLFKLDSRLIGKHWKVVELNGKKVTAGGSGQKEPHLILNADGNKVTGHGGCNSFFGSYETKQGNQISFSQLGSTRMACPDMETESQFFQALEAVDNYTLAGDTLLLNKAKMAPLVRLVAFKTK